MGLHSFFLPILLLILSILPPLLGNVFYIHIAIMICVNIIMVTGLSLIARTGLLSMGQSAFAGIGAYCFVVLYMRTPLPFWIAAFIGVAFAAVIAYLLGRVILRMRGVYFVLVTFAFAEFVRLVLLDLDFLTGGASGVANIPPATFLGLAFTSPLHSYGLIWACAALCIVLTRLFLISPQGQAFDAIGENTALAEASGISTRNVHMKAFVLGSALTGFGGVLLSSYIGFISPESFNINVSITMVIMLVVGGISSIWGPVVGALLLTPLPEIFRGAVQAQHFLYGMALIIILRFIPGGLTSLSGRLKTGRKGQ